MDNAQINRRAKKAELLEKVRLGHIGTEEAERISQALDISILREPKTEDVDVHQERQWNLGMVLAWISWRAPYEVRWFWSKYVQQKQVWKSNGIGGFIPAPATQWTAAILLAGYAWKEAGAAKSMQIPEGFPDPAEAKIRLWDALMDGHLTAIAFDHGQGKDVILDPSEWRVLDLVLQPASEQDMLRIVPNEPHLSHVVFERQQVIRQWPPRDRSSELYPTEHPQIKFRFLSPSSVVEARPAADHGHNALRSSREATIRKGRRTRRPSPQQKAVLAWYAAHGDKDIADMSDQRVADAASAWAGEEANRWLLGRDPVIDKKTVNRLRKKALLP